MTTCNRAIVLSATIVFASLSTHAELADASDSLAIGTKSPGSFIAPSNRRGPGSYADNGARLTDVLCGVVNRGKRASCPPNAGGAASPPGTVTAKLPNLRLNIILREIQNVLVSGSGVDISGTHHADLQGYFQIGSSNADYSLPLDDGFYFLPLPAPGDTWSAMNNANQLFAGLIVNGCLSAATFELSLHSSVFAGSHDDEIDGPFGGIQAEDSVTGPGYYNFKYTIRATDPDGNQSDVIFSGDADSFCTIQPELP